MKERRRENETETDRQIDRQTERTLVLSLIPQPTPDQKLFPLTKVSRRYPVQKPLMIFRPISGSATAVSWEDGENLPAAHKTGKDRKKRTHL